MPICISTQLCRELSIASKMLCSPTEALKGAPNTILSLQPSPPPPPSTSQISANFVGIHQLDQYTLSVDLVLTVADKLSCNGFVPAQVV